MSENEDRIINDALEDLLKTWKLKSFDMNSTNKYSVQDGDQLNEQLNLSYFYQTHLLPQPWWGNIIDPKIIVLALNPSYDPINDENDEKVIRDSLIKALKGSQSFSWLNKLQNEKQTETSGYKFWSKSLGSLLEGINEEQIIEKIGFFNFVGYHSNPFKQIPKRCFKSKSGNLVTTEKLIRYLNLIKEHADYVIVLWGYDYWKNANLEVEKEKLVIVNKYRGRNHIITDIYRGEGTPRKGVQDFIEEGNVLNQYVNLIEKLQKIIQK